jgi:hypothetical protein
MVLLVAYASYISMGGQVQIRFRSPVVLFTRATDAQNLCLYNAGKGYAAF